MSNIVAKNRTVKIGPCFCVAASWSWTNTLAKTTVGPSYCLRGNRRVSEQVELNSTNNQLNILPSKNKLLSSVNIICRSTVLCLEHRILTSSFTMCSFSSLTDSQTNRDSVQWNRFARD